MLIVLICSFVFGTLMGFLAKNSGHMFHLMLKMIYGVFAMKMSEKLVAWMKEILKEPGWKKICGLTDCIKLNISVLL